MKTAWAGVSGSVGSLPAWRHWAGTAVMGVPLTVVVVVVSGPAVVVVDGGPELEVTVVVLVEVTTLVEVVVEVVVVSGAASSLARWISSTITITAMTASTAATIQSRLSAGGCSGG